MRVRVLTGALVLLVLACPATAQQPDPDNSFVVWEDLACGDSKVIVCPQGDGDGYLTVRVKDVDNAPIGGAAVWVVFTGTCDMSICPPVSATTSPTGLAVLPIQGGLDVSGDPACCEVTTRVICRGVEIPWLGTDETSDTREWLSYDLNGNCIFDLVDELIFQSDFATDACRTDYNCDGTVTTSDFILFTAHGAHACTPITPEPDVDVYPTFLSFHLIGDGIAYGEISIANVGQQPGHDRSAQRPPLPRPGRHRPRRGRRNRPPNERHGLHPRGREQRP